MKSSSHNSIFRKPIGLIGAIISLIFVLAACAPASAGATAPTDTSAPLATSAPAPTQPPAATATPAVVEASLSIATDPKYGKILVDGKGMTLYMFTKDAADKSNCTAKCLASWPPLLTSGNPKLGDGVDKSMIGSAALPDGTQIVT